MNTATLKELCKAAGVETREFKMTLGHLEVACFSIATGDPVNTILDLVQVVLDEGTLAGVDDLRREEGSTMDEALSSVLFELLVLLRSPKQHHEDMEIVLYWPELKWEET